MGAAGGVVTSLVTMIGANLENGAEFIVRQVKLNKHIKNAPLVITGEGTIDSQTIAGKTPHTVAK